MLDHVFWLSPRFYLLSFSQLTQTLIPRTNERVNPTFLPDHLLLVLAQMLRPLEQRSVANVRMSSSPSHKRAKQESESHVSPMSLECPIKAQGFGHSIPYSSCIASGQQCAARAFPPFTEEITMPTCLCAQAPVRATVSDHTGPQTPTWAHLDALDRGNLRTAIELHRQVSRPHQNMVASPFNVQAALSMLYTGARDHTAKEMSRALSWDLAPAQHAAACRFIRAKVMANVANTGGQRIPYWNSNGQSNPPATLHLAHRIWADPSVPVEPEFEDALALYFDSTTGYVDFRDAAAASERINSWVSEQTRGCIPELVTASDVRAAANGGAKLVLTTAIYLRASWREPFRMKAQSQPFTPDGEPSLPVRMMTLTQTFDTHETQNYEAVDVAFNASDLAMRLFRPKHGLAQLEATLRERDLSGNLINSRRIQLTLPLFKVTTDLMLNEALTQMGLGGMFNDVPLIPNFTGISDVIPPLRVDKFIHKVFIRVDKSGTEAAAATTIMMGFGGCARSPPPPPKLTYDCSFLFMIHDRQRPLFLGRIYAPSEAG